MDRLRSKPLLLVADANPENISVLKEILASDFSLSITSEGEEVVRLASAADTPKLILLGEMPTMADSYDICRTLKATSDTTDIPIIILAEPTTEDAAARGIELGVADYISRPFKKSVVHARIRTHLELRRYRDNLDKSVKKQVSKLHEEVQERRDIEDTYRALVEHARDGIAIIHDFEVRYANPAFCTMLGYSEEELTGAHLKKFISEEEFIKNTTRYSNRIKGLNLPRIYKSRVIHSDGTTFDVELNVSVVPYGRSLAALVFMRDMREEEAWKYLK